jgi:hypothetical protein
MAFARDAPSALIGDDSPLISVAPGRPLHPWTPSLPSRQSSEELLLEGHDDHWFCESCAAADSGAWRDDGWKCQKCGGVGFSRKPPSMQAPEQTNDQSE